MMFTDVLEWFNGFGDPIFHPAWSHGVWVLPLHSSSHCTCSIYQHSMTEPLLSCRTGAYRRQNYGCIQWKLPCPKDCVWRRCTTSDIKRELLQCGSTTVATRQLPFGDLLPNALFLSQRSVNIFMSPSFGVPCRCRPCRWRLPAGSTCRLEDLPTFAAGISWAEIWSVLSLRNV